MHTELFEHLITLIKDEVLDVFQVEGLLPDQSQDSSWCAHHNVGAVAMQGLLILLDVDASKEYSNLYIITILRKTLILLINLKSQLPVDG